MLGSSFGLMSVRALATEGSCFGGSAPAARTYDATDTLDAAAYQLAAGPMHGEIEFVFLSDESRVT